MEVETTSIEINIMNYRTRLADCEISECANVNIFASILRKKFKLYYQKVKLMYKNKTKQKKSMTTFNRI